jgi:two-component system KDP operon response regulator KdpE
MTTAAAQSPSGALVLVVEDERALRETLPANLRARGFRTAEAADGSTALRLAAETHPDAVVLDLGLPDLDGWT